MSDRKRITCPETGHLEEVVLERTPLGLLVTGCSRFGDQPLACPRECTRRMDRRDVATRAQTDPDLRACILILVANLHDDASRLASMLAEQLTGEGMAVELANLEAGHVPPLADYDAVVIGANVRLGYHERSLTAYIREHLAELSAMPGFWYCVGYGSFHCDAVGRLTARRTGWQPTATWSFIDATASQQAEIEGFAQLIGDAVPGLVEK